MALNTLAQDILTRSKELTLEQRYLVGVVGLPGSGKSYISEILSDIINCLAGETVCAILPMDGYHYARSQLNSDDLAKRGQPHTFNAGMFANAVLALRNITNEIDAPSFDHELKDPVDDSISIRSNHKFVIVEGLYLFLDDWSTFGMNATIFNMRLFVHAPRPTIENRIADRHVQSGICSNKEEALQRWNENDLFNGLRVLESIEKIQKSDYKIDYVINNKLEYINIDSTLMGITCELNEFRV